MCCIFIPRLAARACHKVDVKFAPLSLVMYSGSPYLLTQLIKALAQFSTVCCLIGVTSGHLVFWSIIVKRYLYSLEEGRGPTMSTWMWASCHCVVRNSTYPISVRLVTFDVWQRRNSFAHFLMPTFIPHHTYLSNRIRAMDRPDGWDRSRARLKGITGDGHLSVADG